MKRKNIGFSPHGLNIAENTEGKSQGFANTSSAIENAANIVVIEQRK